MTFVPYPIPYKKIRGHETLTHTFSKRIGDKTNQNNNNNDKVDKRTQLNGKYKNNFTSCPLTHGLSLLRIKTKAAVKYVIHRKN